MGRRARAERVEPDRTDRGPVVRQQPRAERPHVRPARYEPGRRGDGALRLQVRLPPLASRHGGAGGRQRRQPGHDGRSQLDPSYAGAHAEISQSAAVTLRDFFGTDRMDFSLTNPGLPGVVRSFQSFSEAADEDRKSTRLNSSHSQISYAVF